jgi:hypothetical protein
MAETIALFGATGNTGSAVLQTALDAGYAVRIMVRSAAKVKIENPKLTIFEGDYKNVEAIEKTVAGADYVISVAGGPMGKPAEYPVGMMLDFVKLLVKAMMAVPTVKVFLYQSGAFVPLADGTHPLCMRFMKKVVGECIAGIGPNLTDNHNVHKYIASIQGEIQFKTIVTRPGGLNEGGAGEIKLAAVTSGCGPMGMTAFKDLGRFTVEAIKDESLYGSFPFVHRA